MANQQQPTQSPESGSVPFLLAEHRYFAESFWRNEETEERRVGFYVILVVVVVAALAAMITSRDSFVQLNSQVNYPIAIFALGALLLVGVVMLLRAIHRNRVAEEYKQAMSVIRDHFRRNDPWLQDYNPIELGGDEPSPYERQVLRAGGHAGVIALLNSIVLAALVGLLVLGPDWLALRDPDAGRGAAIAALAAGFISYGIHAFFIFRTRKPPAEAGKQ